jgi:hypothetical protein
MNVEQSKRPIRLGVVGKSTLVGVSVDFTLDGRTFWRLSHFLFLFLSLLLLISTLYPLTLELAREKYKFYCQENLTKFFIIFLDIGIVFAKLS